MGRGKLVAWPTYPQAPCAGSWSSRGGVVHLCYYTLWLLTTCPYPPTTLSPSCASHQPLVPTPPRWSVRPRGGAACRGTRAPAAGGGRAGRAAGLPSSRLARRLRLGWAAGPVRRGVARPWWPAVGGWKAPRAPPSPSARAERRCRGRVRMAVGGGPSSGCAAHALATARRGSCRRRSLGRDGPALRRTPTPATIGPTALRHSRRPTLSCRRPIRQ